LEFNKIPFFSFLVIGKLYLQI